MEIPNPEQNRIGNREIPTTTTTLTPCSYATNWIIAGGSLHDSVTFETSDSVIDSDAAVDSTNKPLLVLKPHASGSEPCEITLTYSQKHEIRQVYVRSTARVYEIYYKPDVRVSNEYLCTVRCSTVANGAELLRASDDEDAVMIPTNGSVGELSKKKPPGESNVSTNEDDWVEVKNPVSPVDVVSSLPTDSVSTERSLQDFYEATAQISDAEPSATLTLRLLSLEDKRCVYVDEIYIFADPVESTDLENQAAQTLHGGNPAGSSLMAMLIPTLLQLPRSKIGQSQDKLSSSKMVEKQFTDERPRSNDSIGNLNENNKKSNVPVLQDVKLEEVTGVTAQAAGQLNIPVPVLENEKQYYSVGDCNNNIGRVMEQLVSRISRIEDLCLKFEEKMVKPITSMEERLQRVESQLDVIVKNTQYSGFPSCTRFSAPAFSSLDSTCSSLCNDGCANPPCVQSEAEKYEMHFDDISKSSGEDSKSTRAPVFTPSLVITVPDFSCGEEDEQSDIVEPHKGSPSEKQKQPLSIDDALAAALAGFSSMTVSEPLKHSECDLKCIEKDNSTNEDSKCTPESTSTAPESSIEVNACDEPLKYTKGLNFKAPDFTSEDNGYDDKVVPRRIENENLVYPSDSFATDAEENRIESISAATNASIGKTQETKQIRDEHLKYTEGLHFKAPDFTSEDTAYDDKVVATRIENENLVFPSDSSATDAVKSNASLGERQETEQIHLDVGFEQFCEGRTEDNSMGTTNYSPSARAEDEFIYTGETSNRKSEISVLDRFEILRQLLAKTEDGDDNTKKISGASFSDEKAYDKDVSSSLDFGTTILEVKFASSENSSSSLPLEALLTDAEIEFDTSVQRSHDADITNEASDLSSVSDEERTAMQRNELLVDIGSYDAPVSSKIGAGHLDPLCDKPQEIFSSLI